MFQLRPGNGTAIRSGLFPARSPLPAQPGSGALVGLSVVVVLLRSASSRCSQGLASHEESGGRAGGHAQPRLLFTTQLRPVNFLSLRIPFWVFFIFLLIFSRHLPRIARGTVLRLRFPCFRLCFLIFLGASFFATLLVLLSATPENLI